MISVILLVDDKKEELKNSIDCFLQQTVVEKELLIIDRGYHTTSFELIREKYENNAQIQYLSFASNVSVGKCLNSVIGMAKGEYITIWNEGVTVSPLWLEKATRQIQHYRNQVWSYCAVTATETKQIFPNETWQNYKKQGFIFQDLFTEFGVQSSSVVFLKSDIVDNHGFDEALSSLVVQEFLLRLSQKKQAVFEKDICMENAVDNLLSKEALTTRCYFIPTFASYCHQPGILEQVFTKLLEDIEDTDSWDDVKSYLDLLCEDPVYQKYIGNYMEKRFPVRICKVSHTDTIAGVTNCVGCGACATSCPTNAIQMVYDEEGFFTPVIMEEKCIHCGKCLRVCPTQVELESTPIPRTCDAVQADDSIRMSASSGGVFPVLADTILEQGGYVAGAVYDANFQVHHIVSNQKKDILAMQTSKYVQSKTVDVYPKVQELLEQGKQVLFTGCVCQIAGLKAYLGKTYDSLYTVDVVCHGVPSVGVYKQYLRELQKQGGVITEVNFRKKEVFGWNPNLYVNFRGNKSYRPQQQDFYMTCFLQNWILRTSCYECEFKAAKYSDLTIADFWGIQYIDSEVEDGKGTSYVTVNTEKGALLYDSVLSKWKLKRSYSAKDTQITKYTNPCITKPVSKPKFREIFFNEWKKKQAKGLRQTVMNAFSSLHFDVALVLHWSANFGNALTNYALYTHLAKSRNVLAIDNCSTLRPKEAFLEFAKQHYECSSDYYPSNSLSLIEDTCSAFMVGSDQVWNHYFNDMFKSGNYYFLDFLKDKTRKIAYGSSFGMKGAEPPAKEYTKWFQRFYRIGVRERFGVDICKECYGVDAQFVLDPVFLLEQEDYSNLASESKCKVEEPFILAYILNPTKEKVQALRMLKQKLGENARIISICESNDQTIDLLRHALDFTEVQNQVRVEDWLYYFKNCAYVVTDSFHGTCFSLIFQKNFMTFVNRQPDRFTLFEEFGDASSHICNSFSQEFFNHCMNLPDYDVIQKQLDERRKSSREWLEDALREI